MRDLALSNVLAFPHGGRLPLQHDKTDPLDRKNLEHAYIAMHVAAQYDDERVDGFLREIIAGGRSGEIADILNNNLRAIRYLRSALDFAISTDTLIAEAAARILTETGGAHVQ